LIGQRDQQWPAAAHGEVFKVRREGLPHLAARHTLSRVLVNKVEIHPTTTPNNFSKAIIHAVIA
jgi:hypothetical protein